MLQPQENWKNLTTVELEEEVNIRLDLYEKMVGTLYPRVLLDQIAELRYLIADRRVVNNGQR